MFNFFRKHKLVPPNGVVRDPRTFAEKAKDYRYEELFTAQPLTWQDWKDWKAQNWDYIRQFEVYNQNGSGSCVGNATALTLSIENYLEEGVFHKLSARDIYARRKNKPQQGMFFQDAGEIGHKHGATLSYLLPHDGYNEAQMNDLSDYVFSYEGIADIYRGGNYVWIPLNIDDLAQVLARPKPVVVGVRFGSGEWNLKVPTIKYKPASNPEIRYGHGITALPKAYFTYNGKKAVLIQDSWSIKYGIEGRRILTEDWFENNRIIALMYFENLEDLYAWDLTTNGAEDPKYQFKKNLSFGMRNADVAMLQRCLGYIRDDKGYLFPLSQATTGYFGGITLQAVKRFQELYKKDILEPLHLTEPTGFVGKSTRKVLNKLFK